MQLKQEESQVFRICEQAGNILNIDIFAINFAYNLRGGKEHIQFQLCRLYRNVDVCLAFTIL